MSSELKKDDPVEVHHDDGWRPALYVRFDASTGEHKVKLLGRIEAGFTESQIRRVTGVCITDTAVFNAKIELGAALLDQKGEPAAAAMLRSLKAP